MTNANICGKKMNDFTKDELYILFKCIRLTEMEHGDCAELDNLVVKVRGMIDNYCEHDFFVAGCEVKE